MSSNRHDRDLMLIESEKHRWLLEPQKRRIETRTTPTGYFGDSSRNVIRAPGEDLLDLSVGKTFSVGERLRLQIRFEAFNALNNPQFGFPDPGVNDGANFGTIHYTDPANRENQGAIRLTF
jgi:hypothetical protein